MGLFDWFRKSSQKVTSTYSGKDETVTHADAQNLPKAAVVKRDIDFTLPIDEEEKEIVSVIVSAIAAEHYTGKQFRIKEISRIDTDKEIAAAIVGTIAANEKPNSNFVLRKIERIN